MSQSVTLEEVMEQAREQYNKKLLERLRKHEKPPIPRIDGTWLIEGEDAKLAVSSTAGTSQAALPAPFR